MSLGCKIVISNCGMGRYGVEWAVEIIVKVENNTSSHQYVTTKVLEVALVTAADLWLQ